MIELLLVAALAADGYPDAPPVDDAAYAEEQKAIVAAKLRDPESARFRNLSLGLTGMCGEVNGKNAYGGYAGFRRFYVAGDHVNIDDDRPTFASLYEVTCKDARPLDLETPAE